MVVATDVYWDGTRGPVTPRTLRRWALHSINHCVYLITRPFYGEAGGDDVSGYRTTEGVWFKDREGFVNFSSDEGGYGYPKHMGLDFLRHKSCDGMSITFIRDVGPYQVHKVAIESLWTQKVPPMLQEGVVGAIARLRFDEHVTWIQKAINLATRCFFREQARDGLVHMETFHVLTPTFGYKIPTGHIFDSVVAQVRELLRKDGVMSALQERYPNVYGEVVEGTAKAILYRGRSERAKALLDLREGNSHAEEMLIKARAPAVAIPTPSTFSDLLNKIPSLFMVCTLAYLLLTWVQESHDYPYLN